MCADSLANRKCHTFVSRTQLGQWGSTALSYDADGNMTSVGSWNARNQLTGGNLRYDAFGRRVTNAAGTSFLYDGLNPVQELSGATPTANMLTGFGLDEFFSRTDTNGGACYLSDAQGSTVALSDSTSSTLNTFYTYEPFGSTTASGAASSNPYQFTGRENDGNGLYYYRARYYDPQFQRFVSEDPLEFGGGDTNLYAYVGNGPTNFSDPTGQAWPGPMGPRGGPPLNARKSTGGGGGGWSGWPGQGGWPAPGGGAGPAGSGGSGEPGGPGGPDGSGGPAGDPRPSCFGYFVHEWGGQMSPFPTDLSPTDLIEPTGKYIALSNWELAMGYAAKQGLISPYRSSIFRGLVGASTVAEEATGPVFVVATEGVAFGREMSEMWQGSCQ
jgi:RHS repeat-associated protein